MVKKWVFKMKKRNSRFRLILDMLGTMWDVVEMTIWTGKVPGIVYETDTSIFRSEDKIEDIRTRISIIEDMVGEINLNYKSPDRVVKMIKMPNIDGTQIGTIENLVKPRLRKASKRKNK